jgi:hypothetical protein
MSYRLTGLPRANFQHLFGKSDAELKAFGVTRLIAQEGYPCRVTLEDAVPGESVLLMSYEHLGAPSAYCASGPIFVREGNHPAATIEDRLPEAMRDRLYSVRAYDGSSWMVDAEVGPGSGLEILFDRFFADPDVRFLHLHHARRGCFACRVDRA